MAVMICSVGYVVGTLPLAAIAQKFPTGKVTSVYVMIWGNSF